MHQESNCKIKSSSSLFTSSTKGSELQMACVIWSTCSSPWYNYLLLLNLNSWMEELALYAWVMLIMLDTCTATIFTLNLIFLKPKPSATSSCRHTRSRCPGNLQKPERVITNSNTCAFLLNTVLENLKRWLKMYVYIYIAQDQRMLLSYILVWEVLFFSKCQDTDAISSCCSYGKRKSDASSNS